MSPLDLIKANKAMLDVLMRVIGNLAIEPSELKEIHSMVTGVHETLHDLHKFVDGQKGNASVAEVVSDAQYTIESGAHLVNPSHNPEPLALTQIDGQ